MAYNNITGSGHGARFQSPNEEQGRSQAAARRYTSGTLQLLTGGSSPEGGNRSLGDYAISPLDPVSFVRHVLQSYQQSGESLDIAGLNSFVEALDQLRKCGHPDASDIGRQACRLGIFPIPVQCFTPCFEGSNACMPVIDCLRGLVNSRINSFSVNFPVENMPALLCLLARLGEESCITAAYGAHSELYTFRKMHPEIEVFVGELRDIMAEGAVKQSPAPFAVPIMPSDPQERESLNSYLSYFQYRPAGLSKKTPKQPLMPASLDTAEKIDRELQYLFQARQQSGEPLYFRQASIIRSAVELALTHTAEKIFSHTSPDENLRLKAAAENFLQQALRFLEYYEEQAKPGLQVTDELEMTHSLNDYKALIEDQRGKNQEAVFYYCQQISRFWPDSEDCTNARLEMVRICLCNEYPEGRNALPPETMINWLMHQALEGNELALLYLENAEQHEHYQPFIQAMGVQDVYHQIRKHRNEVLEQQQQQQQQQDFQQVPVAHYGAEAGLERLDILQSQMPTEVLLAKNQAEDQILPLVERVKVWEMTKAHAVQAARCAPEPTMLVVKSLEGDTWTLDAFDCSGPIADLCMTFVEKGYPLATLNFVLAGKIVNNRGTLAGEMRALAMEVRLYTTMHLVCRNNTGHLNRFLGSKVDGQCVMPHKHNSVDKVESILKDLFAQAKGKYFKASGITFLELQGAVQQARSLLESADIRSRLSGSFDAAELEAVANYLELVMACLEIYKLPFIEYQHGHIASLILQITRRYTDENNRLRSSRLVENGPLVTLIADKQNSIPVDKQLLHARCPYFQAKERFSGVDIADLTNETNGNAKSALMIYLAHGQIQLDSLSAQETIELYRMANHYQANALELACLINILNGIKYNLLTVEQLRILVGLAPAEPVLSQALEPLVEV